MTRALTLTLATLCAVIVGCAQGIVQEGEGATARVGTLDATPTIETLPADQFVDEDANLDAGPPEAAPDAAITPLDSAAPQNDPHPPWRARHVAISTIASPAWVAWGEIEVIAGGQNVALGRPVTASQSSAHTAPSRVVDGDPATLWNAGDFAPATIEIDLGAEYAIERVRLRVVQSPAGQTTHALRVGMRREELVEVKRWIQYTREGDWLEYFFALPAADPAVDPNDPIRTRGADWVYDNPLLITGLSMEMPAPNDAHMATYFDDFGASAAHLWTTGLPNRMDAWRAAGGGGMPYVAWVDHNGMSTDNGLLVGGYPADVPGRIGYQVGEPATSLADLEAIEAGITAIRDHDPKALLYAQFDAGGADVEPMLAYYANMDADVVVSSPAPTAAEVYSTAAVFRAAALNTGRPYWCSLPVFAPEDGAPEPHATTLRWTAFAHALLGYTGYTWLPYEAHPDHDIHSALFGASARQGDRTTAFGFAAQINRELAQLGRALSRLTSTAAHYVPGVTSAASAASRGLDDWAPGAGGDPYLQRVSAADETQDIAMGFFVDERGEHYFAVQNPNHAGGRGPTARTDAALIHLEFQFPADEIVDSTRLYVVDAVRGEVAPLDLSVGAQGASVLTLELPAGDLMLFKYATETPFAWQD